MADPTTPRDDDETLTDAAQDSLAGDSIEEAEIVDDAAAGEDVNEDSAPQQDTPSEAAETPAPAADPAPAEPRRGPGFVPLLLGGVVAAGLGYGAAYMGLSPSGEDTGTADALATIQATLDQQGDTLTALTARATALEEGLAALPPAPEPADLAPVTDELTALGARIDTMSGQISGLTDRVAYLETLPLGAGGEGGDNSAAMAAAVAQLQAQLQAQTESLAAQQAENAALAEEIRAMAAAAEDSIAAAEARAEARVGSVTAQAALGQLRIAAATGAPFAGALADVTGGTDVAVPEALAAAAETGMPTLEELQATFPAAARAALPAALRETAGDGAMNRFTAFVQSQVGGRSLEPREGDDPDAVLSRAEAALRDGDLEGAVSELAALPDDAQAEMAGWVASAEARIGALAALDAFSAALDSSN